MTERRPDRTPFAVAPGAVKPPWWLITRWMRWGWFGLFYPGLMGYFALDRLQGGRGSGWDGFFVVVLVGCVVVGLLQLVLTLRAYRQDPTLRTREWPSPPPGPGVSRRVCVVIALLAIAAIGLVLLVYAGWQGALFVVAILAGLTILFVRFDLFADDPRHAREGDRSDRLDQEIQTPDR